MRYKCGNCSQEFNHQTSTCPTCNSTKIYQTLVDAEPDFLNEALHRDAQIDYYRPSTNLGNFSVKYSHARHTLTITVRMCATYIDRYYEGLSATAKSSHISTSSKFIGLFKSDPARDRASYEAGLLSDFTEKAIKAVAKTWDRKFNLTHKRFKGTPIDIEIKLEKSGLENSHYQVDIIDIVESEEMTRNQAAVREAGLDKMTSYHYAKFSSDVSGATGAAFKREKIVSDLVAGYKIPIPDYGATAPSHSASSSAVNSLSEHASIASKTARQSARLTLHNFVASFRQVVAGTDYKKYKILIEIGAPAEKKEALKVFAFGELNQQEISICTITSPHSPPGHQLQYIKIQIESASSSADGARHIENILRDTTGITPPKAYPDQITVCHEFGHMLGLPDEYECIGHSPHNSLRHLGMNVFRTDEDFDAWNSLQTLQRGKPLDQDVVVNQKNFLVLCDKAHLIPPLFGHTTPSLMSAGSVLHEYHAVTILEAFCSCLGDATQIDDWNINLKA